MGRALLDENAPCDAPLTRRRVATAAVRVEGPHSATMPKTRSRSHQYQRNNWTRQSQNCTELHLKTSVPWSYGRGRGGHEIAGAPRQVHRVGKTVKVRCFAGFRQGNVPTRPRGFNPLRHHVMCHSTAPPRSTRPCLLPSGILGTCPTPLWHAAAGRGADEPPHEIRMDCEKEQ